MLTAAIACGVGAMAQDSRVATLQHGSGIQAFYGENALNEAHEAAVDGDVITLSSGNFNGCNISKAITIRGEGITKTTIIKGSSSSFKLPKGSSHALTFEGLSYSSQNANGSTLTIEGTDGTEKIVISKCSFIMGQNGRGELFIENCQKNVIHSQIGSRIFAYKGANVVCINSVLNNIWCDNGDSGNNGKFDVQNCVLFNDTKEVYSIYHSSIKNSIICAALTLDNTNKTSHCLVKEGSSGFSDSWSVNSMDGYFTGYYHLTDNAAATYVGTDGTEIGIYGGMYPYDTTPDYPLVKKLDVIGSHKDGKLNIKINVE